MSVRNFLRRQADVNHSSLSSNLSSRSGLELERPLSEYDNIKPPSTQTHFPLSNIKFRFDDSPLTTSIMNNNTLNQSAVHYNNSEDPQTTTLPVHQYENVSSTLQARNKRESDQQVKMNQTDDRSTPRSVMSVAKSSFFGLNEQQKSATEEFDKLIEDLGNAQIVSSAPHQYENVPPNRDFSDESKVQANQDKVSATSSASGSSSTTATPSSSPTRQERTGNSRKNSEGSNRSKSPKFMLPESSTPSSPSQTVYMSTTVPQNIKGQNIMGRHKPTRHSLRHSRMIVTSKHFQAPSSSNALNIRYVWLAQFVLILKVVVGISLVTLGGWICLFANSTPIQQNPFWSGLILIASGLLGLYLLTFRRSSRSKLKANFFWFLKMNASVIIVMSVFLTTLALIYASFHYISLESDNKKCFPENVFINSSSCICIFNVNSEANVTRESIETHTDSYGLLDLPDGGNIVHFRDLSCNELSTWTHILLASMILNVTGLVLSVCFMTQFIFGCKRRRKRTYVSVRSIS